MSEHLLSGTAVATPVLDRPERPVSPNEFAELKRRIRAHGLLEKRPGRYAVRIALTFGAIALGVVFLFLVDNIWLQLVNAAFLAVLFAQVSYIAHDSGHRQVFSAGWKNEFVGMISSTILGMGRSWWVEKHNMHHSHPNQTDHDPDLNIPFLFFTEEEARYHDRSWFERLIIRHQAFFFFPLLCFVSLDMKKTTFLYLIQEHKKLKMPLVEWGAFLLHIVLSVGILLLALDPLQALAFLLVNQALLGFILGSAFAPNHKGMPVLERDCELDFLHRQIITARNIEGSVFNDFWYGGLNYQIEHHLFPSMPRANLKKAQTIVKDFCQEHNISYAETSLLGSYREIMSQLSEVGAAQKALVAQKA